MADTDYLYYRKWLKSPKEYLLALSPEMLFEPIYSKRIAKPTEPQLREFSTTTNLIRTLFGKINNAELKALHEKAMAVHRRHLAEYDSAIGEVEKIRQLALSDHELLMRCLGGSPLSTSQISAKRKEGCISNAEERLSQMLREKAYSNWHIYHQVDVSGLRNPIDIVAVSKQCQIYGIELDGPHHLLARQRKSDDERDELLLNRGFHLIRVGYDKYGLSCAQAVMEILLILEGPVRPEHTHRPQAFDEFDQPYDILDEKRDDFYKKGVQRDSPNKTHNPITIADRHCFIYCQSTGVDETSQIVDFCLLVEQGNDRKQYYSMIRPSCPIGKKAASLHGINRGAVKNCPSLRNYLEQHTLKQLLEDSKTLVVTYDWDFMGRVMKNSAPPYLNWQKINLYSLVSTGYMSSLLGSTKKGANGPRFCVVEPHQLISQLGVTIGFMPQGSKHASGMSITAKG